MTKNAVDVKSVFAEALEITSRCEREAYLAAVCAEHSELQSEVEDLLKAFDKAGSFMESPAREGAETIECDRIQEGAGAKIGRYKLLQQIGEGGFGVVYMAEQEQPVRRKVALKIVKPGMDSKEIIARFEAERQALALMEHPNIAHVLDAGTTETGRPYFVMELVKGISLTDYCDQSNLGTHERLRLFIEVCQAVHHAHQRGIIHRDIKPNNILVTLHDGQPVAKVIDFGVAKATNQRLTERTLFTSYGQMVGTPLYMSPEQAAISALDVDTRTDIYSLGVVLYELLTGTTPLDRERFNSADFDEVRRIIREEEPTKPSTKISTLGDEATTVAEHRHTDPKRLSSRLRGDLDWIVMKALEKDRSRRYDTAKDFAADVERHLNHQPVAASPPSIVYRLRKYIRRHQMGVSVAAVAAIFLIALGAMAWHTSVERGRETVRARWRERVRAEIAPLVQAGEFFPAYELASEAEAWIPDDAELGRLWELLAVTTSVRTNPPGAEVTIQNWRDIDAPVRILGKTPLEEVRIPRGTSRMQFVKDGCASVESLVTADATATIEVSLDSTRRLAESMVHVRSPDGRFDFFVGKYEITNREYKAFINDGGYVSSGLWGELQRAVGQDRWKSARRQFVDATGEPGPATWRDGDYPAGEADYPVVGVSWFEAAAYAQHTGMELPSVEHWEYAAAYADARYVLPLSNIPGERPARVGSFPAINRFGLYDVAGNVKEWCYNACTDETHAVRGGAYLDDSYMFTNNSERFMPLLRDPDLGIGFRCVKYLTRPSQDQLDPVVIEKPVLGSPIVPLSSAELVLARKYYAYERDPKKAPLNPERKVDTSSNDYIHETITINAAYGNERFDVHLFLPRNSRQPFQTVVYFPGAGARGVDRFVPGKDPVFNFVHAGRAVCYPIYSGTFERSKQSNGSSMQPREFRTRLAQDLGRAVDYLLTRSDVDQDRLIYMGLSWGAIEGPLMTVIDGRFKASVWIVGGRSFGSVREIDPSSYAAHVRVPVLMLNGRNDPNFPVETRQMPLLEAVGCEDKHIEHYDSGHSVPWQKAAGFTHRWLAERLGPPISGQITNDASEEELSRRESIATRLIDNGILPEAESDCLRLLQIHKQRHGNTHRDTLRIRSLIAMLRNKENRTEDALDLYEAVLNDQIRHQGIDDPDTRETAERFANSCGDIAWKLCRSPENSPSQFERAEALARRALDVDPQGVQRRFLLGWANYRTGDLEGAVEAMNESARLDDPRVEQCLLMAMIQAKRQQSDIACAWYVIACESIARRKISWKPVLDMKKEARELLDEAPPSHSNAEDVTDAYEKAIAVCPQGQLAADLHFRRNNLPEAEANLAAVADSMQHDHFFAYNLSALTLYLGDESRYRQLCSNLLSKWKDTDDPNIAERVAKAAALVPIEGEDLQTAVELANRSIKVEPDHRDYSWFLLAKGLVEYRSGRWNEARAASEEGLQLAGGSSLQEVHFRLLLAMTHCQMGETADAEQYFNTARGQLLRQFPNLEIRVWGGPAFDWCRTLVLYREAEKIMTGAASKM